MSGFDPIVVLRTNEERTADLSEALLRREFSTVRRIQVRPFHEAVRHGFELAIESKSDWLVTCDGDVLVNPGVNRRLARVAEEMEPSYWQAIGQVKDKLAGCARLGGLRLYRVAFLHKAVESVAAVVRPEAELCKIYPRWLRLPDVFGSHDYEQYYRDLYRKGAQHRVKHQSWAKNIVPIWSMSQDKDLLTALAGWHGDPMPCWDEKEPL